MGILNPPSSRVGGDKMYNLDLIQCYKWWNLNNFLSGKFGWIITFYGHLQLLKLWLFICPEQLKQLKLETLKWCWSCLVDRKEKVYSQISLSYHVQFIKCKRNSFLVDYTHSTLQVTKSCFKLWQITDNQKSLAHNQKWNCIHFFFLNSDTGYSPIQLHGKPFCLLV